MQTDCDEVLDPVSHRGRFHAQERLWDAGFHARDGIEGGTFLCCEHGGVDKGMVIVEAVEGVEVVVAGFSSVAVIRESGAVVGPDRGAPVADQDVEVRGHVVDVAGVGDKITEVVGGVDALFWGRRHFDVVDVEVEEAWVGVGLSVGVGGESGFEDRLDFLGGSFGVGLGCEEVPEGPGGDIHEGVGVENGHVEVVREAFVDGLHGGGVGPVDGAVGFELEGSRGWEALGYGFAEALLERSGVGGLGESESFT